MELSHISSSALSYVVWYHLQNFICISKFGCGCGMDFRENAISMVADNLRGPEDQVEYLHKNRIFPNSLNCPACDIGCERVNWKTFSISGALIAILKGKFSIEDAF